MTMAGLAYSNLSRRAARTFLTILGIALAVGTAVALLALGRGILEGVSSGLNEMGTELIVGPRKSTDILSARLPEAMGAEIGAIDGVAQVSGELYAFAVGGDNQHLLVAGWSRGAGGWERAPLLAGRLPAEDRREMLAGDVLAQSLAAGIGDTIELFDEDYEIVGITRFSSAMNRSLLIMPLAQLQEAALRPGQVSFFTVRLQPGIDAAAQAKVRTAIGAALPVIVSNTEEILSGDRNLETMQAISSAVSLVALATGAVSLLATLLISVQERTREIGMMTAIGWSDGRVVSLIALEGLLMGLAGCALGVVLGLAASSLFEALPAVGTFVSFAPRASDLVLPLLFAVPLCALGAAYPAWRAVRLMPAEALRRA
jgi:putative ABC transport system permease protein